MRKKEAGILLHVSSLPNKYGIGTFGKDAFDFIDFLNKSNLRVWQILPLTLTSFGDSPYQSPSSKGLNPYFIDFEILEEEGLLLKKEYENIDWGDNPRKVNYSSIFENKMKVLQIAFKRFNRSDKDFEKFVESKEYLDFSVFMSAKEINDLKPWYEWKEEFKVFSEKVEKNIINNYEEKVLFYEWTQYEFLKQYNSLRNYAKSKNVKIMGDIPIYVAYDSVEVWKNPELFQLNDNHVPTKVAGCPPDCFTTDGQLWGNPLYNWDFMKTNNYEWWSKRIDYSLKLYDYLRIDHFRGFSGYYAIPYGDKTARNGKWIKGPGFDLFKDKLDYPIVAEDLGQLDDDFYEMMNKVSYPGMKVAIQGFDGDPNSIWKPSNYTYNFFSYTGTHDSQTTRQFIDELTPSQKAIFISDLKKECIHFNINFNEKGQNDYLTMKLCEINYLSASRCAICPMQDLLAIGEEGRMNFPSTISDKNWSWRSVKEDYSNSLSEFISNLMDKSNRDID